MTSGNRIGILGGTFDPVHVGHLETALAAERALGLDRVLVMPSGMPPHRHLQPFASAFHRFAMTAIAVTGLPALQVSDFEVREAGPSYTFDTLARLHQLGLDPLQIFFITGADAFAEIETWSRYPQVLDMANFAVVSRPGHRASSLRSALPALAGRMTDAATSAASAPQPAIFLVDAPTPDVSSTAVRRRLQEGQSIDGLVPPMVATYITQHALYTSGRVNAAVGRSLA
jgi:nicotinate-nucleotide adenylyltransferase